MADLDSTLRRHERVGLDTSVFIYHIEGTARFAEPAGLALDELAGGTFAGVTSVLTLMEIAVKPLQLGRPDVARRSTRFSSPIIPTWQSPLSTDQPRGGRPSYGRGTASVQPMRFRWPLALEQQAAAFLTNDRDLRRVTEIQVLLLADFVE